MTYQEFKKKYNGKKIDVDGAYGAQCWDLGQKYITECLKLPSSILAGCGLVSNMLKNPKKATLLKYFDEVSTTDMWTGDIVIWEYGHIAIFDHWDSKTKTNYYFSQNPNAPKVMTINRSGAHAFRKKGWNKNTSTDSKKERVKKLQTVLNSQYKCGLAVDGSFGPLTEKACNTHYLYYLKKNATSHIKWLQNRLIELGYSVGKCGADGSFGPDTLAAIKKFQKDKGLTVDGNVGPATHKKLVE